MSFPGGISGTQINPSFSAGRRLRHELYIDTGDADANLELFESIASRRVTIEGAYGRPLEFDPLPNRRACRIADYFEGEVAEEDRWDEFIDWYIDAGERLRRALAAAGVRGGVTASSEEPPPARRAALG